MPSLRFQTKLSIVYLALFIAVQAVIFFAIWSSVTNNVRTQITQQLAASARVLEQQIEDQVDVLGSRAQDLSKDFGFRQAVATQDKATIESALVNLANRLNADAAFVYSLDDELLASAGARGGDMAASILSGDLRAAAEDNGYVAQYIEVNGDVFELVIAPIVAPVTVGWVGLAAELDQQTAMELRSVSAIDLDIGFTYENDNEHIQTRAVTNPAVLAEFLLNNAKGEASESSEKINGEDFLFYRLPLQSEFEQQQNIDAVLFYSLDAGLKAYQPLVLALTTVLAISLVILVLGSMAVARGITRPIRQLASAAEDISKGNYQAVSAPAKDEEILRLTSSFNNMVAAVRDRERRIIHQAQHDVETGLPNRVFFENRVEEMSEGVDGFILGLVEIQDIQDLRSVLTDAHVNQLMAQIADRLETISVMHLSQVTTETFAFVHKDSEDGNVIAAMIINAFIDPFKVEDLIVDARACLGMASFPADGDDVGILIQRANSALDNSRGSQSRYAWYSADSDQSKRERLSLMSELRDAIASEEVQFFYQPKLDMKTNKITAVEALIRWISPTRGFVPPDDFIPLAEKTGDVKHLTQWGLRAAVSQIAEWQKVGREVAIAVNLSTNDLMDLNLPSKILALLNEYSVKPSCLKLEVTESALMHDMDRALEVLNMLNAMGHSLSIDDYGTGYSSLSYIKSLPVDEIKIDKSFVLRLAEDDEDKILVRSTIEMAHNLGLQVTAEGVEDDASLELLRSYGCNTLQGFHICKPLAVKDFEEFWKTSKFADGTN